MTNKSEDSSSWDEPLILRKSRVHNGQMEGIRRRVLAFAAEVGWGPKSRGRRASVSIYGDVRQWSGVIDIEIAEPQWERMPERLAPETEFILWCSAGVSDGEVRGSADTELYWSAPFAQLPRTVDLFLPAAWDMLLGLGEQNLLWDYPGPARDPDTPPHFGPPRWRGSAGVCR